MSNDANIYYGGTQMKLQDYIDIKVRFNDIVMRELGLDILNENEPYLYDLETESALQIKGKFIKYLDYEDYEYPILKSDEIEFNVIENARLMETISIPFFNRYFNRFGSAFHSMSQTRINGSNKGIFVVYYIDSTGQAREIASNAFKNESVRIFNLICKLNDMEHLYKFNEFDIDPLKKKSR